jgi:arylsulfatase A-like enzyme
VAPGWGPIPNEQYTLSEILQTAGYRTALISDLYHQFKPSKSFWRGFDQWTFIRGQETDTARSGPGPTQEELDQFIPRSLQATFVRHPGGVGAGTTVDAWIQHHDIMPTILEALEIAPPEPIDGRSFWGTLLDGAPSSRDHVVIGWGTAMTVITDRWWFNAKVDGTGALLYDRTRPDGFDRNVADEEQAVCRELFGLGRAEAKDGFPEFLLELAMSAADAPGCSPFAAG